MFKKYLTTIIAVLVVNLALGASVLANDNADKTSKYTAKIKANIAKLGTGKDAEISVKLADGTKLKGYVSELADDHFSVTNSKTGAATAVDYRKAKQVKGHNLSTGAKIAIGIGIAVAVFVILAYVVGPNVAQ